MERKKKIIWILNNFAIGGSERVVVDIISQLKTQCDIDVVTILGNGPFQEEFEEHASSIYFAGAKDTIHTTFFGKVIWILFSPLTIFRLFIYIAKKKPDVVVSSLFLADVLGMFVSRVLRVKTRVVVQHDVYKFGSFKSFLKKNLGWRNATKIVAVSKAVESFLSTKCSQEIVVIPNGIDVDKMMSGARNESDLVLGYLGRLETIKGPQHFLRALRHIDTLPKIRIVGDGSLMSSLKRYSKDNMLFTIKFVGSTKDVPGELREIDVLVIPSEEEGFGLVVIEALFAGKIVIVSNIPAFRELISDGTNGLFFKNTEDLARIITQVLNDKQLRDTLHRNIKLWANENRDKFDISTKSLMYAKVFGL